MSTTQALRTLDDLQLTPDKLAGVAEDPARLRDLAKNISDLVPEGGLRQFEVLQRVGSVALTAKGMENQLRYLREALQIGETVAATGGKPPARAYTHDEGVALLMAVALSDKSGTLRLSEAAQVVQAYRAAAAGRRLGDALGAIALDRFSRFIIARVLATVVRSAFGERGLAPGSVVFWHLISADERARLPRGHGAEAQQCVNAWVEQLCQANAVGIVAETGEILLERISAMGLAANGALYATVPAEAEAKGEDGHASSPPLPPRYLLIVKTPAQGPLEPPVVLAPAAQQLVEHLLDGLRAGLAAVAANLERAATTLPGQQPAPPAPSPNVLLWMMACFARLLCDHRDPAAAAADDPAHEQSRCLILEPDGSTLLVERADSFGASPWEPFHQDRWFQVSAGQVLSGYAATSGLTLSLVDPQPPLQELVTRFAREQTSLGGPAAFVAVPVPRQSSPELAVLYALTRPCNEDHFAVRVRALQALAPIVGELLDRERGARRTTRLSVQAFEPRCLCAKAFEATVRTHAQALLGPAAPRRSRPADARLALVILKAIPVRGSEEQDTGPLEAEGPSWLNKQLVECFQPARFLSTLGVDIRSADGQPAIVCGRLGDGLAILFRRLMDRRGRDHLRRRLPMRVNRAMVARTDRYVDVARLVAWVVDEKCPPDVPPDQIADRLLARARQAEYDLANIVGADRLAYEHGEWRKALGSIEQALLTGAPEPLPDAPPPDNAYLHRRAAEYYLRDGDFRSAEREAGESLAGDPSSVTAFCLLGDARLAQGKLDEALEAYNMGLGDDSPVATLADERGRLYYRKAFALLLTAEVLSRHMLDLVPDDVPTDAHPLTAMTRLVETKTMVRQLAETAAELFSSTRRLWQESGGKRRDPDEARYWFSRAGMYGSVRAEVLAGTRDPSVRLDESGHFHPRDDLFYNEHLWVQMWRARQGALLCDRLRQANSLDQLLGLARKHLPGPGLRKLSPGAK